MSCYQTLDITDVANGGEIVAVDFVALHLYNIDLFGVLQSRTGLLTETTKTEGVTPITEKESGVATIVDKQRTIWIASLRLDNEQQVALFVLFDTIHIIFFVDKGR